MDTDATTGGEARQRGRPRHFDEDTVLDQLTELFWQKGFAQTSMSDLVEASGVHKSSLYSTFGGKDELFAKILHRYFARRMDGFTAAVEDAGPGIGGIHSFLDRIQADMVSDSGRDGCLLINSSSELAGSTPGFEDFGTKYRSEARRRIRTLIAQAGGNDTTIDLRTSLFVTYMIGLTVTTKGGADETEIGHVLEAMHAIVDSWDK